MKRRMFLIVSISLALLFHMVSISNAACVWDGSQVTITNDPTGGMCPSIGQWNPETKTCSMDRDISGGVWGVGISGEGITLDGNGHTISGLGMCRGIDIIDSKQITVKNVTVKGFATGIYVYYSSSGINIVDNKIIENTLPQYTWNSGTGIQTYYGSDITISGNVIQKNGIGISLRYTPNATIVKNSFIDNVYSVGDTLGYANTYSLQRPIGGNYWSKYDSEIEGCIDGNKDGFCDEPYYFDNGIIDYLPWNSINIDGYSYDENEDDGVKPGQPEEITIDDFNDMINKMITGNAITNVIAQSMKKSLENISDAINKGNMNAASNMVEALINKVKAQSGKNISTDSANEILDKIKLLVYQL